MSGTRFMQVMSALRGSHLLQQRLCTSKVQNLDGLKGLMAVRNMGKRVLDRKNIHVNFSAKEFIDNAHFVLMVHGIAIGTIIVFTNLFMGKMKLADIPDGYEPKYWEYYDHPISQFMARYLIRNPEMIYENNMESYFRDTEKRKMRLLDRKIERLSKQHQDFNCWYYIDKSKSVTDDAAALKEEQDFSLITRQS